MTRLPTVTSQNDNMRRSLGVSVGLHVAVILFLYFGLPSMLKPLPVPTVMVPFEIVDVADITNTRVKDKPEEAPKPPAPPPKPEEAKVTPPPPPPAPPQETPKPPEPPKPEVKPEQVEAITPIPKPAEKPKPPEQVKPKEETLASVLKNVEKMKHPPAVKTPDIKPQAKPQTQPQTQSTAPALSSRLTISQEDALRRQIELHWNVPIGARGVENMVVHVQISVNPDRSVAGVEVVDKMRMNTDSYFRAMAESVVRAIYSSSPLELPPDKYEQWKLIDSNFSAKDML